MNRLPLLSPEDLEQALREARTIAVLGIKPESREQRVAHDCIGCRRASIMPVVGRPGG